MIWYHWTNSRHWLSANVIFHFIENDEAENGPLRGSVVWYIQLSTIKMVRKVTKFSCIERCPIQQLHICRLRISSCGITGNMEEWHFCVSGDCFFQVWEVVNDFSNPFIHSKCALITLMMAGVFRKIIHFYQTHQKGCLLNVTSFQNLLNRNEVHTYCALTYFPKMTFLTSVVNRSLDPSARWRGPAFSRIVL